MNLCGIPLHDILPRRPLGDVCVGNPYFGNYKNMEGTNSIDFNINFIMQLDNMFRDNNMNILSNKQKDFMNTFIYEAGKVTDAIIAYDKLDKTDLTEDELTDKKMHIFDELSETMLQLDSVLAQIKLPEEEE